MSTIATRNTVGPASANPRTPNTKLSPGLANPPETANVTATKSGTAQSKNL